VGLRLGIQTGADLRSKSAEFLARHFGKAGPWYYAISRGEDDRPVRADRERKSSGSETTFAEDLTDADAIERGVLGQADEVWAWCEKANAFGHSVVSWRRDNQVAIGATTDITRPSDGFASVENDP
jgi:DNA polymerase IV